MPVCLRRPELAVRSPGLELQMVVSCLMSVLRTKLRSSERAASALTAKPSLCPLNFRVAQCQVTASPLFLLTSHMLPLHSPASRHYCSLTYHAPSYLCIFASVVSFTWNFSQNPHGLISVNLMWIRCFLCFLLHLFCIMWQQPISLPCKVFVVIANGLCVVYSASLLDYVLPREEIVVCTEPIAS